MTVTQSGCHAPCSWPKPFCLEETRLHSPPPCEPLMLLVAELEKNYIRETILCLLVKGEYTGVLPGLSEKTGTETRRNTTQTVYSVIQSCKHYCTLLFFFGGPRYECGSWLTLHVESSMVIKRPKIAYYRCAMLWPVCAQCS